MDTLVFEDSVEELREAPAWDWSAPFARSTNENQIFRIVATLPSFITENPEPPLLRVDSNGERGLLMITPGESDGVAHINVDISRARGRQVSTIHFEAEVRRSWIWRLISDVPAADRGAVIVRALEELAAIDGQHTVTITKHRELPPIDR